MNKIHRNQFTSILTVLFPLPFFALLMTAPALAQNQAAEKSNDWNIESSSLETFFSEDRAVYYGAPGNPAVFTYDTMKIEGDPINISYEDGEITLLTTTGTPAIMQKTDDEGRVYTASAESIHYNNADGLITMQGDAEIIGPDGINFNACFIEYLIETNSVRARACSPDDRVNMSVGQEETE